VKLVESNWLMKSYSGLILNGPMRVFLKLYKEYEKSEFLSVINRTYMMVYELIYF